MTAKNLYQILKEIEIDGAAFPAGGAPIAETELEKTMSRINELNKESLENCERMLTNINKIGEYKKVMLESCASMQTHLKEGKEAFIKSLPGLKKTSAILHKCKGVEHEESGELSNAVNEYTQAISFDPEYHDAYLLRGQLYFQQREFDRAIADCAEAMKINQKDAVAYIIRGASYACKGQLDKSRADIEEALRLEPTDDLRQAALEILKSV